MRRARVLTAAGLLCLLGSGLTACGGAVRPVASDGADVGCGGWYIVSHDVLTAELQLNGAVHEVAVNALLDDGTTRGTPIPLAVVPGSARRTVKVGDVSRVVVSARARVIGATDGVQATCELSNPH